MREQAIPLAKEALAALSKRYQFTPKGPLLIEMFPKHDDFAVRTIGLPGMIGALGACFGRVVTLDSPRARTPGEFNWGETLWHELAHVITLQMSGNRVPRWLTEGISVYEERRARPEWGKESDVSFAQALADGKAIKLDVLNEAFSDPKTISLAYYQASLVVDHLVQTYGEPALWKMLRAYGRGLETEDALQGRLRHQRSRSCRRRSTRYTDKNYGAIVRALKAPELKEKPSLDDLKKLAADNPESFRVHMALADALEHGGRQGRRDRDLRARRAAAADGQRPRQPARLHRADRDGAEGQRPRHPGLRGRAADRQRRRRVGAQAGRRCSRPRATPRGPRTRTAGWWRPIRSTARRRRRSGGWRCKRKDTALGAARRSAARWRPSRRTWRPRTPISAKRSCWRGRPAEAKRADARGARDRAVVRARAGPAAEDRREPGRRRADTALNRPRAPA